MRRKCLLCPLLVLITALQLSAAETDHTKAIDSIFTSLASDNAPGAAVLVLRNGHKEFEKAYGVSDLRTLRPIDPVTNFRLASCSKQFTAMAIMLLVQDGKLHYEDRLTDIFPDFPEYGQAITIRNLLNHTSGLLDYEDLMAQPDLNIHTDQIPQIQDEEVLQLLKQQKTTKFVPGTKWEYSNSGYVVLGTIVAKVSGKSFPAVPTRTNLHPSRHDEHSGLREGKERNPQPLLRTHEGKRHLAPNRPKPDVGNVRRRRNLFFAQRSREVGSSSARA